MTALVECAKDILLILVLYEHEPLCNIRYIEEFYTKVCSEVVCGCFTKHVEISNVFLLCLFAVVFDLMVYICFYSG